MKKTRFFLYLRIYTAVLGWLILVEQALERNLIWNEDTIMQETEIENKKEKEILIVLRHQKDPIPKIQEEQKIRVVILDDSGQEYYQSSVSLCIDGEILEFSIGKEWEKDIVRLTPENGKTEILSISRSGVHPLYEGTMEIRKEEKGILLINELPVETYLKSVVPSEMPAEYEMEALKAQAVCARTYAYRQMEEKRMQPYFADVDDSVNCQVYGNFLPEERTSKAVEETEGMVIRSGGELIEAYYFSTSAGVTSTEEVWQNGEDVDYLKSVACTFDEEFPWRNWEVTIPWKNIEQTMQRQYGMQDTLKTISVQKKSQSGAVTELLLTSDTENYEIHGEYQVREVLSPEGCSITQKNGDEREGPHILPSAYFHMTVETGKEIRIEGAGYGHGVGMSQNAAQEMAKEGYKYPEILEYFFDHITIEKR